MTAAAAPERIDLPALTGVRGLAAWFVVLYHLRTGAAALPPEIIAVAAKGYLAVDLFFLLSGFVLWLNAGEALGREGVAAAPRFLVRRVARLWPLHLAILAGAVAFALVLDAAGRPNRIDYPWGQLPLHLLLVQNWGFTDELAWNDPAWSISCEWAAYLLLPLFALAVDWRRLSTGHLLAVAATLLVGLHLVFAQAGHATLGADIPRLGLPRALIEFTLGTLLCALWQRARGDARIAPLAFTASAAFLLGWWVGVPETLAVPAAFAALLLALALTAERGPLASRAAVYLGEISYATYLVHFLLYVAFKLFLVADPAAVPLPLLGGFLLLTLATSVLLHHGVEKPSQRALNRWFERSALRGPAKEQAGVRAL